MFLNDDRGSVLNNVDRQISRFIQQHFGDLRADITGMAKLLLVVRDMVVRGQTLSIIVSLLLVWLLTSFMFRSMLLGLYNAIPLFFGIFLNFAIMGWFNIPLNVETMVTSSVAIGVGIDYAIHFVHRYRQRILA
ncbi:MAG: MMPL family transporter, partial [candidate division KSB1 bacterium]|nr:MMPL family transporter [candidate division KSB1 bacterium]